MNRNEIKKDLLKDINPLWCGFERSIGDITRIVVHGTAGGGTLNFMKNGGAGRQDDKIGLFHYLIEKNGEIIQLVEDLEWCYHSSSGQKDRNSIGIELLKLKSNNGDVPTTKQYEALQDLIILLKADFNLDQIMSHDYSRKFYSNKPPKPCPGTFDWNLLKKLKIPLFY